PPPKVQRTPDFRAIAETKARARADTAGFRAQQAATDARFAQAGQSATPQAPKARGFFAGMKQSGERLKSAPIAGSRVGRVLGGAALAIPAAIEAVDVAAVAGDENSTGMDVATQAAEGTGRFAATTAAALKGAQIGGRVPGPPLAKGAGAVIGGAIGGFGAYRGYDAALSAGRELAGVDPASPVDRVRAGNAMPDALAPRTETEGMAGAPGSPDEAAPGPGSGVIAGMDRATWDAG